MGRLGHGQEGQGLTPLDQAIQRAYAHYEEVTGRAAPETSHLIHLDKAQRVLGRNIDEAKASKFVAAAELEGEVASAEEEMEQQSTTLVR